MQAPALICAEGRDCSPEISEILLQWCSGLQSIPASGLASLQNLSVNFGSETTLSGLDGLLQFN